MANTFRLMQRFWLDIEKPDEYELAETIQDLKEERSFSRAIRQGLRLWVSLRQRDTSVLFELFPWLKNELQLSVTNNIGNNTNDRHEDQIKALQTKIDTLTELVLQKETSDKADTPSQKQLSSSSDIDDWDLHTPADGLLEVKKAEKDARNNSSYNFMIASALQVYGNYDALPPEIIAYGVETGRIPIDKVKKIKASPPETTNPKAMDVPQFAAPEFDDLDVQF